MERLGRTGVVDALILEILRQALADVESFFELGIGDVEGEEAVADRSLGVV